MLIDPNHLSSLVAQRQALLLAEADRARLTHRGSRRWQTLAPALSGLAAFVRGWSLRVVPSRPAASKPSR